MGSPYQLSAYCCFVLASYVTKTPNLSTMEKIKAKETRPQRNAANCHDETPKFTTCRLIATFENKHLSNLQPE